MRVAKWGVSLAIRIPAAVAEALELKAGDHVEVHVSELKSFGVARNAARPELLKRLRALHAACPRTSSSTGTRPMPGRVFDTSVPIHRASGDTVKADKAERALDDVGGVISVQVLGEFVNVARRKMRLSWPRSATPRNCCAAS